MSKCLLIAAVFLIAGLALPATEAGALGVASDHRTPAASERPTDQAQIIRVHDGDSWNDWSRNLWPYYYSPYNYPRQGGYGNGFYGSPGWGYPYSNYYYNKPKRLTERQVVQAVKYQRFHRISKVWFDDGLYKVRAVDYHGRPVLLLVDPYSGQIVRWSFRR
jgi:hypothetical protein